MPEPHKFEEGDQVTVKRGNRAGQHAVLTEIRPNAVRLRFADDEVLLYGLGEIEPATSPEYSVGDRFRIKERCPHNASRWHLADRNDTSATVRCGHERDIELVTRGNPVQENPAPKITVAGVEYNQSQPKSNKPVRLVGITGRKRAGKDTVAARLVEKYGFKRMAFADNVRKVALAIDPLIETEVGLRRLSAAVGWLDWEKAKEIPEVRRILQKIGTEGIRSLEPDFWIRQVMRQAVFSSAPIVITDVRFPNEADAIKKAGGVILRVNRPGLSQDDQHSSESAMDGYLHDWSLRNSGTVEFLHKQVDELVASGFKPA